MIRFILGRSLVLEAGNLVCHGPLGPGSETLNPPQTCWGSMSAWMLFIVSNLKSELNWLNKGKFLAHPTERPRGISGSRWGGIQESNVNSDPAFSSLFPRPPRWSPDPTADLLQPGRCLSTVSETPASLFTDRRTKNISCPCPPSCTSTAPFRPFTLLNPCSPGEGITLNGLGRDSYCFLNNHCVVSAHNYNWA